MIFVTYLDWDLQYVKDIRDDILWPLWKDPDPYPSEELCHELCDLKFRGQQPWSDAIAKIVEKVANTPYAKTAFYILLQRVDEGCRAVQAKDPSLPKATPPSQSRLKREHLNERLRLSAPAPFVTPLVLSKAEGSGNSGELCFLRPMFSPVPQEGRNESSGLSA